ncbi:MAG: hypothetical protein A3E83_00195 [Gammaproteobacteria bacterium RIFCSPHIGHO2_12_FULL_41_20]|nr:MAG: hypothetical protein A3E83_00195 [Gammaproteobacteria bacterium RIFCSPHIGHO2_12_FULL_41_20]
MRLITAVILFFFLVIQAAYAQSSYCNGTAAYPCIVQDTLDNNPTLKNWRDQHMMIQASQTTGNVIGLASLWMSGSAMPSVAGWQAIRSNVFYSTRHKIKRIAVVDLRGESHGYLNQDAITLAIKHDWVNRDKTHVQALQAEHTWLQSLRKHAVIAVLTDEQFDTGDFADSKFITQMSVQSEADVVKKLAMGYLRLTVTDHMAPNVAETDRFVDFVKTLPSDTWVHFHCRGGKGRTATFMIMFDMLHNADKVSFNDIIKRQAAVPPYYDVTKVARKNQELTIYYQQRLAFLKEFYRFSQDYLHGYTGTWKEWKNSRQNLLETQFRIRKLSCQRGLACGA